MTKSAGKIFEEDIERSCNEQKIFFHRIKDVNIPFQLRSQIRIPKNKYDNLLYKMPYLYPLELKSTKAKSISMQESVIKQHQIENLHKENDPENGIISGFLFNFREHGNQTFWVYIDDFVTYKDVAEGKRNDITYESKVNKSSIPIGICEEIGIEVKCVRKRVRYRYYINDLIESIKNKIYKNHNKFNCNRTSF